MPFTTVDVDVYFFAMPLRYSVSRCVGLGSLQLAGELHAYLGILIDRLYKAYVKPVIRSVETRINIESERGSPCC